VRKVRAAGGSGSGRRSAPFLSRRFLFYLLAIVLLPVTGAPAARGATLAGRVFTADHPDSIAPGAPVSLIFRPPQGEVQRLQSTADEGGHFHFVDLSPDTSIAYVLRIDYKNLQFLSSPIQFAPGEEVVEFNVLLAGGGAPGGDMPEGHPSIPGEPMQGSPVRPNTLHTILLALWVILVFALLALLARRSASTRGDEILSPAARDLVRDIASLDNRHADGVIGAEEYRKVRDGLMARLRTLSSKRHRA
jgi:hypothetical protein